MAVQYQKMKNGEPVDWFVWADEPIDIVGDDEFADERRRTALDIIARMDGSRKWRRMEVVEPPSVGGPDQSTEKFDRMAAEMAAVEPLEPKQKTPEPPKKPEPKASQEASEKPVPTQADVRAWAKENGIEVNASGRIPQMLVQRYLAEHEG